MRLRTPTLDLIAREYAEAVASGEFERAEGWLAVAEFAASRLTGGRRAVQRLAALQERTGHRAVAERNRAQ